MKLYRHRIAIFDVTFEVIFTDDIVGSYNKMYGKGGKQYKHVLGLCIGEGRHIRVFYRTPGLTCDTIAHELYHATMAFHCRTGASIHKFDHELTAWINGYLNNLVYSDLKRAGIKAKVETP